jgi:hypothetical protein
MLAIWISSTVIQFSVLFALLVRRHYQSLPTFSIYIGLNLCQAFLLAGAYSRFAFSSHVAAKIFWISESITLVAQALAASEVLHLVLHHYSGIWALAWRLIATAAVVVVCFALANAKETPNWRLMIAHRGYHLTFAVALISCLLLVRVYSIPVEPAYKTLLAGFCVYSCSAVIAGTLLQALVVRQFPKAGDIWNYLEMLVFMGVQVAWAVALRHRVTAIDRQVLRPPSDYDRISPEVNSRLRELNDVLSKFLRTTAVRS